MSHDACFPFSDEDHYRRLRDRLIRFFAARGCYFTADLADDTLMRVWQSQARRPGDCSVDKWTFGVARNVLRESNRASRRTVQFDPDLHPVDAFQYTPETSKLELDLLPLKSSERALLHEYFIEGTRARVLAHQSGISEVGIRGRAHRLIDRLRRRLRTEGTQGVNSRAASTGSSMAAPV